MISAVRTPKQPEPFVASRFGHPVRPRHPVAVWHCETCGIDRPRF
jgi:hypothetical protein